MDERIVWVAVGFLSGIGATFIVQGLFSDYPEDVEKRNSLKKQSIFDKTDKIQDEIDQSIGG